MLAAGVLFGVGGFNLYDGTIDHKVLQVHPMREGVADQLPYDLAFNSTAVLLLLGGFLMWQQAKMELEAERVEEDERKAA